MKRGSIKIAPYATVTKGILHSERLRFASKSWCKESSKVNGIQGRRVTVCVIWICDDEPNLNRSESNLIPWRIRAMDGAEHPLEPMDSNDSFESLESPARIPSSHIIMP